MITWAFWCKEICSSRESWYEQTCKILLAIEKRLACFHRGVNQAIILSVLDVAYVNYQGCARADFGHDLHRIVVSSQRTN